MIVGGGTAAAAPAVHAVAQPANADLPPGSSAGGAAGSQQAAPPDDEFGEDPLKKIAAIQQGEALEQAFLASAARGLGLEAQVKAAAGGPGRGHGRSAGAPLASIAAIAGAEPRYGT